MTDAGKDHSPICNFHARIGAERHHMFVRFPLRFHPDDGIVVLRFPLLSQDVPEPFEGSSSGVEKG